MNCTSFKIEDKDKYKGSKPDYHRSREAAKVHVHEHLPLYKCLCC